MISPLFTCSEVWFVPPITPFIFHVLVFLKWPLVLSAAFHTPSFPEHGLLGT